MSVRLKLTLSYAGFLMLAGVLLLGAVWLFLLRYVPDQATLIDADPGRLNGGVFPIRSELLREFAPRAAAVMVALLVFGLAGGWWLAGRMLAPLARITEATRAAAAGSLSHRIALTGPNDEFHELADSFDTMLARLEAQVEEQRRFAANASHELRTPLATTHALLEVARADLERDTEGVLGRLAAVNEGAIALTEALLVLSRADQGNIPREPVDLSLVVEEAVETLLALAEARDIQLDVSASTACVVGSPTLLAQLAMNLVQNAIIHNLPNGGEVHIATVTTPEHAVLTMANTGKVISPELAATLTEPFQRGVARTRTGDQGVGLGLAIVQNIVRAHAGALAVVPRADGGLRVTVQLPLEPYGT